MKRLVALAAACTAVIAVVAGPGVASAGPNAIHLNYSINTCRDMDAYWSGRGVQAWGLSLTTPSGTYGPFKVRIGVLGDCVSHVAQHPDWTSFGGGWWYE